MPGLEQLVRTLSQWQCQPAIKSSRGSPRSLKRWKCVRTTCSTLTLSLPPSRTNARAVARLLFRTDRWWGLRTQWPMPLKSRQDLQRRRQKIRAAPSTWPSASRCLPSHQKCPSYPGLRPSATTTTPSVLGPKPSPSPSPTSSLMVSAPLCLRPHPRAADQVLRAETWRFLCSPPHPAKPLLYMGIRPFTPASTWTRSSTYQRWVWRMTSAFLILFFWFH